MSLYEEGYGRKAVGETVTGPERVKLKQIRATRSIFSFALSGLVHSIGAKPHAYAWGYSLSPFQGFLHFTLYAPDPRSLTPDPYGIIHPMKTPTILQTDFPLPLFGKGKVRDTYDLGDKLLIVATDRISAFDSVLPTGIPGKGQVLTALSAFWFELTGDVAPNHMISTDPNDFPFNWRDWPREQQEQLAGRSMLVKK